MEKTYKIVPFDIELAKKIQSGEVEGRIRYSENDGYAYDAEILKFDIIADKAKVKPNSNIWRTIAAIVEFDNYQGVRTFNSDGYGCNHAGDDTRLFIELPEETPKREFKPFDNVLVRFNEDQYSDLFACWIPAVFQYKIANDDYPYFASGIAWSDCIPYEGNEHLVGTTDNP